MHIQTVEGYPGTLSSNSERNKGRGSRNGFVCVENSTNSIAKTVNASNPRERNQSFMKWVTKDLEKHNLSDFQLRVAGFNRT